MGRNAPFVALVARPDLGERYLQKIGELREVMLQLLGLGSIVGSTDGFHFDRPSYAELAIEFPHFWQVDRGASAECSAFLLNNHAFEPRLVEPKSPLPGNGIFRAETKRPKTAVKVQGRRCRDKISLNNPRPFGAIRLEPGNLR